MKLVKKADRSKMDIMRSHWVKLQVAADQLYPEDYDFSIVFDTVENRKLRHQMDRGKCVDGEISIVL